MWSKLNMLKQFLRIHCHCMFTNAFPHVDQVSARNFKLMKIKIVFLLINHIVLGHMLVFWNWLWCLSECSFDCLLAMPSSTILPVYSSAFSMDQGHTPLAVSMLFQGQCGSFHANCFQWQWTVTAVFNY